MSASSCKAKGRRLQQRVRDDLRAVAGSRLDPTDIESTPMGCNGVDVILTKAARDLFGELAIECKNVEKLNAVGVFQAHVDKYQPKGAIPVMVHSRNYVEPRVTLLWADFVRLFLQPIISAVPLLGEVAANVSNRVRKWEEWEKSPALKASEERLQQQRGLNDF
jgi:hypothetical protein